MLYILLFRLQTGMTEPLNICPYLCRLLHIDRTDNFRCTSLEVQKKYFSSEINTFELLLIAWMF